jgi:GNAT superfamily N-acetyltransferase
MDVGDLLIRRADLDDALALARTTRLGFESYRAWTHPGWRPPDHRLEVRGIRERLRRPDTWCLIAIEPSGEPAGHVSFLAASDREAPHAAIPGRAHLWMLFLRPPWWGSGLATHLHGLATAEAARQGYRTMQLYTPAGQARARAFYEREGWTLDGPTFGEPLLDLELVRYRRDLA